MVEKIEKRECKPTMDEIIIAGLGEMILKGQNRKSFETALLKTARKRAEGLGNWKIYTAQSTLYIVPTDDEAKSNLNRMYERCEKIFGIAALARAAVCEKDFNAICATAQKVLREELAAAKTFKVSAKRADKNFGMNSMEISRELGAYLLQKNPYLEVDVHTPQLTVTVEVREQAAYVHGGKQRGAGGLPVPTSGRAALLLSGGIDSPVAAWLMAKRGLSLVPIHFASPPYTSSQATEKVRGLAGILANWCGPLPYYEVIYTETQEYLRDNLQRAEFFTVLMRRSMLRIAAMIAAKEQCEAIITGESLAQVASQTLMAIACTNSVQSLPVLRPCIGMDKLEITTIARRIATFDTSILPYEDCCTIFTPPHPKTKPALQDVERLEAQMPELTGLEEKAAAATKFNLIMPKD